MPNVSVTLNTKALEEKVRKKIQARLDQAAEMVKVQVMRNLSQSTRANGPSVPGEFPHADTGKLRMSIFWAADGEMSRIVGSPLDYAMILEHYRDRSFLRRTLREMTDKLRAVLGRGEGVKSVNVEAD